MGEVVSLKEYKERKENKEIEVLQEEVEDWLLEHQDELIRLWFEIAEDSQFCPYCGHLL